MTRQDIDRLFTLLRELYPRITPKLGPNTQYAWLAVLEPFEYDAVKAKLLEWNRGPDGRSFPDPRECIPDEFAELQSRTTQSRTTQNKAESLTGADYELRILDAIYGFGRHAMGDPRPAEYLAELDDWESRKEDVETKSKIQKKRDEILAIMAREEKQNGGEKDA